jgi:tetratricopeptide (TPR) repeat protein
MLAEVEREAKNAAGERAALEKLVALADDDVEALSRLVELTTKAKDWQAVAAHAERWLAVNPLSPAPHRAAAAAAEALADDELAMSSYQALLLLEPFDPAEIHLKLATLLENRGELAAAKRHALLALDETPRFRAAYGRLLAIVEKMEQNAEKTTNGGEQKSEVRGQRSESGIQEPK